MQSHTRLRENSCGPLCLDSCLSRACTCRAVRVGSVLRTGSLRNLYPALTGCGGSPRTRPAEERRDKELQNWTLGEFGIDFDWLLTCLLPMKCECPSREVVEGASAGGRACGILHTSFLFFYWHSRYDVRGCVGRVASTKPCSLSSCPNHLKGDGVAGFRCIPRCIRWCTRLCMGQRAAVEW